MNSQTPVCPPIGGKRDHAVTPTTCVGRLRNLLLALAAWAALSVPSGAIAQLVSNCLPTCDVTDGRFLSIPGANLFSLTAQDINIRIAVPSDLTQFQIYLFDGETKVTGGPGSHWDLNWDPEQDLKFELFYDDGTGDPVNHLEWPLTGMGNAMPDNAWYMAPTINTEARAQGKDGLYHYRLRVSLMKPSSTSVANFKLRTIPESVLATIGEPFGFMAPIFSLADAQSIYPDFPSDVGDPNHEYPAGYGDTLSPAEPDYDPNTRYDGTFTFYARNGVPGEGGVDPTDFVLWDGDLDHGSFDKVMLDTDDPDTDNNLLPAWAVTDTVLEGAQPVVSKNPPDDVSSPENTNVFARTFVRTPSVTYEVFPADDTGFPGSISFGNANPSGNQEWERFRLSEADEDPSTADHWGIADLKPGIYKIVLRGMDLQNFNAWRVPAICVDSFGDPCPEPRAFRIGDRVWQDLDGDALGGGLGPDDDGEPGIPGVLMNLYSHGNLINQAVTDADGRYQFRVTEGGQGAAAPYTVQVASENFSDPGPGGAIGCDVYLDVNGSGTRDVDEPGLGNIKIVLRDASHNAIGVALTDANGLFRFNNLAPGDYVVDVADGTVPSGLTLSGGTDPSALLTIAENEERDVSFGYRSAAGAMIGNQVWTDVNNNGMREAHEPGFNGVTVTLINLGDDGAIGGINGNTDTVAATTNTVGGRYLFTNVAAGTYLVEVTDLRARLIDYDWVYGPDETAFTTDRSEPFAVGANSVLLDKDFGYRRDNLPMITDSVWLDTDRDGVRDADESGLANVTVSLNESQGIFGDDITVAVATSDANGDIGFLGLPDGAYRLEVTDVTGALPNLLPTTDAALSGHPVSLAGTDVSGTNFGYASLGQLQGHANTTGGNSITRSVSSDDDTFDFGYRVPQEPCAACEGKVTELTLQYRGNVINALVEVIQKKGDAVVFSGTVQPGQLFSFGGQLKNGTLGTDILVYVDGQLHTTIHTSCSQPIGPGLVSGDFEVIAGNSLVGGPLCPLDGCADDSGSGGVCEPPAEVCGECQGKVVELALQYLGSVTADIKVAQKKDGDVVFDAKVQPGEIFSFVGTWKDGTLGTDILVSVNGQLHTQIHTSCSQPIGPGLVAGDFEVVSGESSAGGALCALPD